MGDAGKQAVRDAAVKDRSGFELEL
jgi:hypothetical protein